MAAQRWPRQCDQLRAAVVGWRASSCRHGEQGEIRFGDVGASGRWPELQAMEDWTFTMRARSVVYFGRLHSI
jgi:hypothetical protein